MVIHSVSAEGERETGAGGGSGKTAAWDRIASPKEVKPLGPQPTLPAAVAAPKVDRIAQSLKAPELPPPDLAGLPDEQQPPTAAPVQDNTSSPKTTAQTPAIEPPKSAPLAAQSPSTVPQPAEALDRANHDSQRRSPGHGSGDLPLVPSDTGHSEPADDSRFRSPHSQGDRRQHSDPLIRSVAPRFLRRRRAADRRQGSRWTIVGRDKPSRSPSAASSMMGTKAITPRCPAVFRGSTSADCRARNCPGHDRRRHLSRPAWKIINRSTTGPRRPSREREQAAEPLLVKRNAGVAPTYRLRKLSNRKENARQFGGTETSERSVEASLQWLARVQSPKGNWDAKAFGAGQVKIDENGVDRDYAGRDADSGVTALAVLAFLGAGYTHEEGKYADNVDRALRWLIAQQKSDGNLGARRGPLRHELLPRNCHVRNCRGVRNAERSRPRTLCSASPCCAACSTCCKIRTRRRMALFEGTKERHQHVRLALDGARRAPRSPA